MKTFFLLVTLSVLCIIANAQVVIGSGNPPTIGALLQLKENENIGVNSTKGLLLPRVMLTSATSLEPAMSSPTPQDKLTHIGLMVFHMGNVDLCAGAYIWNGDKWERANTSCVVATDCNTVTFNGTYEVGTPLSLSNSITLTIDVPLVANGGTYHIYTNTVNGISFSATGTLVTGTNTITLHGTGIPRFFGGGSSNFILNYEFSNGQASAAVCAQTLSPFSMRKYKIWGVGYNNLGNYIYGHFVMESASKMVLENNFGTTGQTVYTQGFTFLPALHMESLTVANYTTHAGWTSKPDIIVHGANPYVNAATNGALIDSLVTYLQKGGTLILFDEYGNMTPNEDPTNNIALQVCKRLFPSSTISIANSGTAGFISYISASINDEVTNGAFGDLRGLPWGHNSKPPIAFSGLPNDSIIVYSTGQYRRTSDHILDGNPNAVTIFRHKRLNLFICGNGTFLGNSNAAPGEVPWDSGLSYNPFAIDANGYPIGRTWWGHDLNNTYTVYNSRFFANMMSWIVKRFQGQL